MTATLPEIGEMISESEVLAILEEIWGSLIAEDEVLIPVRVEVPDDGLSAWVLIVGPWSGSVVITASRPTAEAFSREMLQMRVDEELTHEDLSDACGEVANVLGGNIKSLLHEGSSLGLPQTGPAADAPAGASPAAPTSCGAESPSPSSSAPPPPTTRRTEAPP